MAVPHSFLWQIVCFWVKKCTFCSTSLSKTSTVWYIFIADSESAHFKSPYIKFWGGFDRKFYHDPNPLMPCKGWLMLCKTCYYPTFSKCVTANAGYLFHLFTKTSLHLGLEIYYEQSGPIAQSGSIAWFGNILPVQATWICATVSNSTT